MRKLFLTCCLLSFVVASLWADNDNWALYQQVNNYFYEHFRYPDMDSARVAEDNPSVFRQLAEELHFIDPYGKEYAYEGRVVVRYSIYDRGRMSQVKVVNGLCPAIDKKVSRTLKSMRHLRFDKAYRGKEYVQAFYISADGSIKTELPDNGVQYSPDEAVVPVGGQEALDRFIAENLNYPKSALESGLRGAVNLHLIIDKDGYVLAGWTRESEGAADLNWEALRLAGNLPQMRPAWHQGQPVVSPCTLPISFRLK
ncbi:MAG: energy transducer TonB [Bacteroidales bacterium]|nr:energy transducer TonB [Bacteroidales bacterium]